MKKNILILSLLTLGLAGCSQEELIDNNANQQPTESKIFTATLEEEDAQSRIYVGNDNKLFWTAQDQISIFAGNTVNSPYQKTEDTEKVTFTAVKTTFTTTGSDLSNNYAVYPYNEATTISAKGVITTTLPATQKYAENSFGLGDNTMVAVTNGTEDYNLGFKNVCGYLKLQLYGDNMTVKSIKLTGNNNEKLAGKATITSIYGQDPTVSMVDDVTSITLYCGENGVKVASTAEAATAFWIVVPPTTFENGFTVTVTNIDNEEFSKKTLKRVNVKRNVIVPMNSIKMEVEEIPYMTFTANAEQILTMSKTVETLQYSVNNGTWENLGTNKVTFGGEKGNLRIRGNSFTGTALGGYTWDDCAVISFEKDIEVSCSGDIRTLIDYNNYETANTSEANFSFLFYNCTNLTSAPSLPIMTLADNCYERMFSGCTKLVNAPDLPALELSERCYANMFNGCKSLENAPDLPSIKLKSHCYISMFSGCEELKNAPKLTAIELAPYCYMQMFYNCKKLNKITMLATNISATLCLNGWLVGPSTSSGTLTIAENMEQALRDINAIPDSWAVEIYKK